MKFEDFVCFGATVAELKAEDRDGVIAELVSALDKTKQLGKNNREEIIKAMIKREKEASTGMGKGVAVPHVKHQAVKDVVAQPARYYRQAATLSRLRIQPISTPNGAVADS